SPGSVRQSLTRTRQKGAALQKAVADDAAFDDTPPTVADARDAGASPRVIRRDYNSHTEFEDIPPDAGSAKPDSLGPHGSPRLTGIVQIVLGLGALLLFARVA